MLSVIYGHEFENAAVTDFTIIRTPEKIWLMVKCNKLKYIFQELVCSFIGIYFKV